MATEKGSLYVVGLGRETTFGTAATGNFLQLPVINVEGGLSQPLIMSEALQGNRNRSMPELDEKTGALTIVLQVDVRSIGFVFAEIFGLPTTSGAGPYTHVFKVASSVPTGFTLDGFFGTNSLPMQYVGCKVDSFSIELAPGGLLKMTLTIKFKDAAFSTRIDSAPYKYSLTPMRMAVAELYEGGTQTTKATRFSVNFTNTLEEIRTVCSGGTITELLEGWADPTFNLAVLFENMTLLNKAKDATESAVKLKAFSPLTAASHYVQLEMLEVRYNYKTPGVSGPGGVPLELDGVAYYDNDAGASSIIVTIVNDVTAYTSISA